jgi:selT/selW/selH-like putative selenoprotein
VYDQYAEVIKEKYPDLIVQGDNYPPPSYRMYLAQFFGIGKIVLIIMVVSGFNPFSYFGIGTPGFYNWFIENKLYACMMIFFLSNALEGQFISTGAFEISFNGVPVWSKLDTGRLPSPTELFQIIDSNLQFNRFAKT